MSTTREVAEGIAEQFTETDTYGEKLRRENLTDAIDKALQAERERAAQIAEAMRPSGGRMWTDEQSACFEALTACAAALREGKPPE